MFDLDDARALATSPRCAPAGEYARASLRVLLAILDRLPAGSAAATPPAEPVPPLTPEPAAVPAPTPTERPKRRR